MEQEIEIQKRKQNNIRLYPLYRTFSLDLFFYYSIIYLFLTIEKKISPAQVMLFEAFYVFFKFLVQIPTTLIIEKLGKRKSIIIANFILAIHILVIMFAPNFKVLIFSQLLCAFGFIAKSTCETDLLYDSLEHNEKRGSIFAKEDGKAYSRYYYIDALTAIASGFLFVVNPYLPMILCAMVMFIVFIISTKFEDVQLNRRKLGIIQEFKELKVSFRQIFRSKRLRTLIIFNAVFLGLHRILNTLKSNTLSFIGLPEQYFGVVFAIMGIISAITSKNQWRIHNKYRNTTLAFLSVPSAFCTLFLGFVLLSGFEYEIVLTITLIVFAVLYALKGPYYVLIKQYLNNFTDSEKRVKISTTNNMMENLISATMTFIASGILQVLTLEYTWIIVGAIITLTIVLLLDYMKGTVGLKMEEYGKREII